eukprot:4458757-Pleurochrysis_carterae.AAC.1
MTSHSRRHVRTAVATKGSTKNGPRSHSRSDQLRRGQARACPLIECTFDRAIEKRGTPYLWPPPPR